MKELLKGGMTEYPNAHPQDKNKRFELSDKTREILEKRHTAAKERNPNLVLQLNKEFVKSRREDKKKIILDTMTKDLDLRDRWLGIRQLKQNFDLSKDNLNY